MLEKFYAEDPHDPFNAYALALEYLTSDAARSRTLFDWLLDVHQEYLPTYYHAAKFYQETGERGKAAAVFEKGMALARKRNESKTLRELQSAYEEMMFE